MNLYLDTGLAQGYSSPSQKARVLTEDWVHRHSFCPGCGKFPLTRQPPNSPASDFCCGVCKEEFELKSKTGAFGTKIVDGAYATMMSRLVSSTNLNLFLLSYHKAQLKVTSFMVIPKQFFVPAVIEKRKSLSPNARRAGWTGCNISLGGIPESGKIFIVENGIEADRAQIRSAWQKTLFLRQPFLNPEAKGWLLDVMRVVEKLGKRNFALGEVYAFENELRMLHPANRHVRDKIRQQLQILRDNNYLGFASRGHYSLRADRPGQLP